MLNNLLITAIEKNYATEMRISPAHLTSSLAACQIRQLLCKIMHHVTTCHHVTTGHNVTTYHLADLYLAHLSMCTLH